MGRFGSVVSKVAQGVIDKEGKIPLFTTVHPQLIPQSKL